MESGTKLGHYTISSLLGKGGMGEVYQAKDEKLGRQVAIKVLPEEFAQDADRVARFRREAQLLASLNHPNIAAIHGLEKTDGKQFLVLELVEGPTLADRIKQGAIPVEESLKLALQIAEALEAAHEKGVIHRDLKPANIKITPDGKVKVLDFGLAKAFEGDQADVSVSNSPTLSMAATQAGIILGTAAYMSPEQARGAQADHRADVWAFGVVLFEMLTGRATFNGPSVSDILASVLAKDPPWNDLPSNLHPTLRHLLERCLTKELKDRYGTIGDARVDVQAVLTDGVWVQKTTEAAQTKAPWRLPWIAAIVVTGIVAGILGLYFSPTEVAEVGRFVIAGPAGDPIIPSGVFQDLAISPDGRLVAYPIRSEAGVGLLIRSIDQLAGTVLNLGYEVENPFFSPDGSWIGFATGSDQTLKRVSVLGGPPVTIADSPLPPRGMTWAADDTIVYGDTNLASGLLRVSASGGEADVLTTPDPATNHVWPDALPNGNGVLFAIAGAGAASNWQIAVLDFRTGEQKTLLSGGTSPKYVPTGHIVYAVNGTLRAVPFDADRLELTGDPIPVLEGVAQNNFGGAQFAVSEAGSLVYLTGDVSSGQLLRLGLGERDGQVELLDVRAANYFSPRLSPDGSHLAVQTLEDDGRGTVWVYDLSGNTQIRRLTQEGSSIRPIWTPDSERVTFASDRDGPRSLYWQAADGSGVAERLTRAEEGTTHSPESWSPDGRTLSFLSSMGGATGTDVTGGSLGVWTLSMDSNGETEPFYDEADFDSGASAFSPDGRWIAYHSNESGTNQVYVQPYPPTGVRVQVTEDGAIWPVWSPDGTELFYTGPSGNVFRVTVSTEGSFTFGPEQRMPLEGFLPTNAAYRHFDITPDGQRFLMLFPANQAESGVSSIPQINIVLNWFEELKERVPVP